MAARFGMGGYGAGELGQVFTLLRELRLTAGDFVAEPGRAGPAGEGADTSDQACRAGTSAPKS